MSHKKRFELSNTKLLTAIVFIAIFTMAVRAPADTDSWWHLRSAQYTIDNLTIPTIDPFSHTKAGNPWINNSWLSQIILYTLFTTGNWIGLSLGLALFATVAFWFVWQVTPGNPFIRAFIMILGAVSSSVIWIARPQIISFSLAGLLLLLLERYKRNNSRWIYALPLLTVVWVNLHGGYAIIFMMLVVYLIGETLNRLTGHSDDPVLSWLQLKNLLLIGIVSFLVLAVNPYGIEMWTYPFRTVGIGALRDFIQEWRSPDFHQTITWPFVLMLSLTLTALGRSTRPIDWTDLSVLGLWFASSLFAARNIGLYGLLTVPLLARYSQATLENYLPAEGWPSAKRSLVPTSFNWILLGLLSLAAVIKIGSSIATQESTPINQRNMPIEAVQLIKERKPVGQLFNSYNWGGYLIFELWPDYPVYIDGRTDLYDDFFIRRYISVVRAENNWEEILVDDGVNLVLIESSSAISKFLARNPAWIELYRGQGAVLFERKETVP